MSGRREADDGRAAGEGRAVPAAGEAAPRGPDAGDAAWLTQRERGSLRLMRATFWLATRLGRRPLRPLVAMIALYYRLFDRRAVRASKQWLQRVHGRPPSFFAVYRHIRTFAQVTLDRVFLLTGRTRGLVFANTGHEHLQRQAASGQGAVLLGAHLGSFEAMRAASVAEQLRIQIVGHFANARMINALLQQADPSHTANVIHAGGDPIALMSKVQGRIDAGDFVALLADRTGLDRRTTRARFFGEEAAFPSGPFLLAALLRCPVYLVFGIHRPPNRYELSCEPFAERLELPRRDRQAALAATVQRYAERLEQRCREAPDNWFNFFDFWRPA